MGRRFPWPPVLQQQSVAAPSATSRSSPRVRELRRGEAPEVAEVHRVVFGGSVSSCLGRRYVQWFLDQSETVNLGAFEDGVLVGYALGAPEGYSTRLYRDLFWPIARVVLGHPRLVAHPGFLRQVPLRLGNLLGKADSRSADGSTKKEEGPTLVSVALGVRPEDRARGLAKVLKGQLARRAWERGYRRVVSSVYPQNTAARRLNESCGWVLQRSGRTLHYALDRPP